MKIDFDTLTLGEVEEIELLTGQSIQNIMEDESPKGRTLKVILWIFGRRENPDMTIEDASKITLAQATEYLAGSPDPK